VTSAAPAAAGENIRLSPANGMALSRDSYELRARDGKLICTVARAKAEQAIDSGDLELWDGPHGAYLRAAWISYPEESRQGNVDSRHTLHGHTAAALGSAAARYCPNTRGCETYRGVVKEVKVKTGAPSESLRTFAAGYPMRDPRTTARRAESPKIG
jgi:hypothetical protein